MGGLSGGIDAFHDDRNVWTGKNVQNTGRTLFSFNDVPYDDGSLVYMNNEGITHPVKEYTKMATQRINRNENTIKGLNQQLSNNPDPRFSATTEMNVNHSSRTKGFVGIKVNKYFKFSENTRVVFETNTGFRKVLTSSTNFTIPKVGLKTINARIFNSFETRNGSFMFKLQLRVR